jgi:hypothetical protein
MAKKSDESTLLIRELSRGYGSFPIIGTTPLIFNRMTEEAMKELLYPAPKKRSGSSEKLKHDPRSEYAASMFTADDCDQPPVIEGLPATHIVMPGSALKKAVCRSALDHPDVKKTEIERLVSVPDDFVPIWGVPQLMIKIVRCGGFTKTPDTRTRAILKKWATVVRYEWVAPILSASSIANLLNLAGQNVGIGDWRQEKGAGSFGSFRVCSLDDPEFKAILATGSAEPQIEAIKHPDFYNNQSRRLVHWFDRVVLERGGSEKLDNKRRSVNGRAKEGDHVGV